MKVVLDKKSLSGDDIKKGMSSVEGKAQKLLRGHPGHRHGEADRRPVGRRSRRSRVSGVFAGTPVASCVEAAVKSASFPPWDGGPQSSATATSLAE